MATYLPHDLLLLANRAVAGLPTKLAGFTKAGSQALPYQTRLLMWLLCAAAGGLMVHTQRGRAPGWARLWAILPLVLLNSLLPLLFDGVFDQNTNISCFIITTCLSTFKALGWAMNRGPLVRPLSLVQFLAVYMLPITPREEVGAVSGERPAAGSDTSAGSNSSGDESQAKGIRGGVASRRGGRLHESAGTPLENLRNFFLKLATGLAVGFVLLNFDASLPRVFKSFLYGVGLYCCLGAGMDGPAALAGSLLGLSIAPHFDNPFHSTTIAEFWNRRWNLTVSNALRFTFYDPIYEGRLVKQPGVSPAFSAGRRMAGLLASFFASGVLHELLIWYFSGRLFGLQLVYFTMWAPIIVAESALRHALHRRGIHVPKWLAWVATMVIVHEAGDRLFWEPHYRLGTPKHSLDSLERMAPWLKLKRD